MTGNKWVKAAVKDLVQITIIALGKTNFIYHLSILLYLHYIIKTLVNFIFMFFLPSSYLDTLPYIQISSITRINL